MDTIVLGGMEIGGHTFSITHSISQSFSQDTVPDGLMGLSKQVR
jgi:hypothetical protein